VGIKFATYHGGKMNLEDLQRRKRTDRSTGNYETREELVAACLYMNSVTKLSHRQIGEKVGVAQTTVTRILSGDAPEYRKAYAAVRELPSTKLNKLWKVPKSTVGQPVINPKYQ